MTTTETSLLVHVNELFALEAARVREEQRLEEEARRVEEARRREAREAEARRMAEARRAEEAERRDEALRRARSQVHAEAEAQARAIRRETERALARARLEAESLACARAEERHRAEVEAGAQRAARRRIAAGGAALFVVTALGTVFFVGSALDAHRRSLDALAARRAAFQERVEEARTARLASPDDVPRGTDAEPAVARAEVVAVASDTARPGARARTGRRPPARPLRPVSPPVHADGFGLPTDCRGPLCRHR